MTLLNVQSRFEIPRMVQALQARGHGSLCFYGPPGTGKTALAEHIASTLAQPLNVRRASDLMSKYVGETEQNMAAMFREAEAENAILLLDEADSFLQDRRGAQRNHEVSEVNEMLQGMEHFHGIFICTTNLMDRIDQAALRRFTFKIGFQALSRAQRLALFAAEVYAGDAHRVDQGLEKRLASLDHLCVGDFAAVKRQAAILGISMDPAEFLEQLEAEHRIKPEVRDARAMGFTP
jgi:SpoVK/Ycf46/Vps4 family AAA+-type ATPase